MSDTHELTWRRIEAALERYFRGCGCTLDRIPSRGSDLMIKTGFGMGPPRNLTELAKDLEKELS